MDIKEFTVQSKSVTFIMLNKHFVQGQKINKDNEPDVFEILKGCESLWSNPISTLNQYSVEYHPAPKVEKEEPKKEEPKKEEPKKEEPKTKGGSKSK